MVPEASNASKRMYFDALEIQEPSQIDPGLIWENHFLQINPGPIWDGSWISTASKYIRLNALEASGPMKNLKILRKMINSKINQENEEIWR